MTTETVQVKEHRLFTMPVVGIMPMALEAANELLESWGHRLGSVHRPFHSEAFALEVQGAPVSVAVSASIVSNHVLDFGRQEVVELARLCSHPEAPWATRVMLRLWREVCAPLWPCWPIKAAVSYSHDGHGTGDVYRFDGWRKAATGCGSSGGGAWSRPRYASEAVYGPKTLWIWAYP